MHTVAEVNMLPMYARQSLRRESMPRSQLTCTTSMTFFSLSMIYNTPRAEYNQQNIHIMHKLQCTRTKAWKPQDVLRQCNTQWQLLQHILTHAWYCFSKQLAHPWAIQLKIQENILINTNNIILAFWLINFQQVCGKLQNTDKTFATDLVECISSSLEIFNICT